MRGNHSGEVRRAAGSRDNHANAAARGFTRKVRRAIRRAMRRSHIDLVSNPKILERLRRLAHDVEVGITAHHNRNQWLTHEYPSNLELSS